MSERKRSTVETQRASRLSRLGLTGFMGAGKSTVGVILADILGWRFIDLDDYIQAENAATIADIFHKYGEPYFRERERQAVETLIGEANVVLALGGGTMEDASTRKLLLESPETCIVYLEAPLPDLLARCAMGERVRPLLATPEALRLRHEYRLPQYRTAQITISTETLSAEQVAHRALAEIDSRWLVEGRAINSDGTL